ncbi:hypothetical protein G6L37_07130 [Agrobacterium rubi]|nr:hypothetical protein [Agrobacterium rubi]NTF25139.1 hypothetical protein [Agrobacterium rubi]
MSEEIAAIVARHENRYAGLDAAERAERIKAECQAGLAHLRAAGIKLTMPAHELEALLGNDD